jgi:hypothetical protein
MCDNLCKQVDRALRFVRTGDFTQEELVDKCWRNRRRTAGCTLHELRVYTLVWDAHQARGEYKIAAERLHDGDVIHRAIQHLHNATTNPDLFIKDFEQLKDKRFAYTVWRQRTMGVLAHAFSEFQFHKSGTEEHLRSVELFLDECLGRLTYPSNGSRARLHFFRGIICETNYEMDRAMAEYDRSLKFCIARAKHRLAHPKSKSQYEAERSFVVYCLGKVELKLAQLDFDRGRLSTAKRHAHEAGLLLRASKDRFLPHMADLVACKISRYEKSFLEQGWSLVEHIEDCRKALAGHVPYRLEAEIEAIKTCVYLRHFNSEPPTNTESFRTIPKALEHIGGVILEAHNMELARLEFDAMLVKARTLNQQGAFREALDVVDAAERVMRPLPGPLAAEVHFARGKLLATRAADEKHPPSRDRDHIAAYKWFKKATEIGHTSLTFRIACTLQMADMLLRLGRVVTAKQLVAEMTVLLQGVEHTFLNDRLATLKDEITNSTGGSLYRKIEDTLDYDAARAELEKRYLFHLANRTGLDPPDFQHHYYADIKPHVPATMTLEKLRTIVKRHFPET